MLCDTWEKNRNKATSSHIIHKTQSLTRYPLALPTPWKVPPANSHSTDNRPYRIPRRTQRSNKNGTHLPHSQPYRLPILQCVVLNEELKQLAIQTLSERYPSSEWLRIYTDGSYRHNEGKAGAGIYSSLFSHYISAGDNITNFDAEVKAIQIAVQQLIYRPQAFHKHFCRR